MDQSVPTTIRTTAETDSESMELMVAKPPHRRPPPMRVVTKGWWTLKEATVETEVLAREAADDRSSSG